MARYVFLPTGTLVTSDAPLSAPLYGPAPDADARAAAPRPKAAPRKAKAAPRRRATKGE